MKNYTNHIEEFRVTTGPFASDKSYGMNGAFFIPHRTANPDCTGLTTFKVIVSDGEGWEHVSVSLPNRTPTWEEMCYVKDLFWDEHEPVMQVHPKRVDYVNNHPHCLHMWKPTRTVIPLPPTWMVGVLDAVTA